MHFRISMCTGYSCVKYKHCAQSGPRPAAAAMELEHELEIPNSQNTQHQQQHTCLVRQNSPSPRPALVRTAECSAACKRREHVPQIANR